MSKGRFTPNEMLEGLGLQPIPELELAPAPEPVPAPEPEPAPAATLEQRFGRTEKQHHPNSCTIACLINAKIHLFREKGLDKPEKVKGLEENLMEMAEHHGFDESKGIKLDEAKKFLRDNQHFAEYVKDGESALDYLQKGVGLVVFISSGRGDRRQRHAILIHLAQDRITGEHKIIMRDSRMNPDGQHPAIQELSPEELMDLLISTNPDRKHPKKLTQVLAIGEKYYQPEEPAETAEQRGKQEAAVKKDVKELKKKLTELDPGARVEAKRRLHPRERLRIILETYRPKAEFKHKRLTSAYDKAWEKAYDWEITKGELSKIDLTLEGATKILREANPLMPRDKLLAAAKAKLQERMAEAHAILDALEDRYIGQAIYLSEQFTEIRADDVEYAASLRHTAHRAGAMAWSVLKEKKEPLLVDWAFEPISIEDALRKMGVRGFPLKETRLEGIYKLPIDLLINREGKIQRAWSLYWWARGLHKMARLYEKPHGIDLADEGPYQEEEPARRKLGVWKDIRALKIEYYLTNPALAEKTLSKEDREWLADLVQPAGGTDGEVRFAPSADPIYGPLVLGRDITQERKVIGSQLTALRHEWPSEDNPAPGTLKQLAIGHLAELAKAGTGEVAEISDAVSGMEEAIQSYAKLDAELAALAESLTQMTGVERETAERFMDIQEEVFRLEHLAKRYEAELRSELS